MMLFGSNPLDTNNFANVLSCLNASLINLPLSHFHCVNLFLISRFHLERGSFSLLILKLFLSFIQASESSDIGNHLRVNGVDAPRVHESRTDNDADSDAVFQGARSTSEPNLGKVLPFL